MRDILLLNVKRYESIKVFTSENRHLVVELISRYKTRALENINP